MRMKLIHDQHSKWVSLIKSIAKLRGLWFEKVNSGRETEKCWGTHVEDKYYEGWTQKEKGEISSLIISWETADIGIVWERAVSAV